MSLTNYSDLQTSVAGWLHRADLTAIIPDLVTLGEATINRKLRLLQMENVASLTTSITDRFATLPTGFMEAIDLSLYLDDYPQTLTQVPLSKINGNSLTDQAQPRFYAISSNIVFDVISDEVYTLSLRYLKKLDLATDLTNYVMTTYPDIYLYATLMAAEPYMKNDKRLGIWAGLLKDGIEAANRLDGRSRGKSMLTIESGMRTSYRGNIITGES
jgi:hypothetical protein